MQTIQQAEPGYPAAPLSGAGELGLLEVEDLFAAGQLGVHTYRIPALCEVNGVLIAVCDARQDDASELPGNIDLVMSRSLDGGTTWSAPTYIQDLPAGEGVSHPSLLVDRTSGRVFCLFSYGPPGVGWATSQSGSSSATDPNTLHVRIMHSDDDGLTWSTPVDLNPQIKSPAWRAVLTSSGTGIQTRTGRLIQPISVLGASGVSQARNIYSDDGGTTWTSGARISSNATESKALEAGDGRVVQNMRHLVKTARFLADSLDGGASFLGEYQHSQLVDPQVNAGALVHSAVADGDPEDLWLFSNPANTIARSHLTVRASRTEGATYGAKRIVHAGPAAYSTMVRLADGRVGLLFERGDADPYEAVAFARFDLDWLFERPSIVRLNGAPRGQHPALWSWLDAGHGSTLNGPGPDLHGDPITRWEDRGGHRLHHLVRSIGAPPSLLDPAVNGLPAVDFTGPVDLWGASTAPGEYQTCDPGLTLLMVARVDQADARGYLFDRTTGAGGVGLRVEPGAPPVYQLHVERAFAGSPISLTLTSGLVQLGQFHLHTVVFRSDQLEHRIDTVEQADWNYANGDIGVVQAGLMLGADLDGSNGFEGAVAELLMYDEVLEDADLAAVEAYLMAKYGL